MHGGNSTYMLVVSILSALAEALVGVLGFVTLRAMLLRWRLLAMPVEKGERT